MICRKCKLWEHYGIIRPDALNKTIVFHIIIKIITVQVRNMPPAEEGVSPRGSAVCPRGGMGRTASGLAHLGTQSHRVVARNGRRGNLYAAHHALVARDILLERQQHALGMLGGQHYAALNPGLGQARHNCRKVHDELRRGVRYYNQIGVMPLCHRFFELDIHSYFILFHACLPVLASQK